MNKFTHILISVIFGIILGIAFCLFFPKPVPEIITKVAEVHATQKPDLRIKSKTNLTGQAKITPVLSPKVTSEDGNQPSESLIKEEAILALKIDSVIVTELAGEQKINYYNSAGGPVGSGIHPVTAELTTKVLPDGVDFRLEFPDEVSVEVDYEPPETHNRIELGYNGNFFMNYTYDFKPFFMKYDYDFGDECGKIGVGLEFEF
jgi:hypothetical protein